MYEYEVKVKVEDLERVKTLLRELGAEEKGLRKEVDVYFRHPCRDFRATDEALRLRLSGGRAELTYKGPKISRDIKAREEITVEIREEDVEKLISLLENLGFKRFAEVRKTRERYELGDFKVCLDSVEGLGDFIEVELKAPGESLESATKKLREFLVKLGIKPVSILKSYLELLLERKS